MILTVQLKMFCLNDLYILYICDSKGVKSEIHVCHHTSFYISIDNYFVTMWYTGASVCWFRREKNALLWMEGWA